MKATYKDITFEGSPDEVVKALERILFDEKASRGWIKTNEVINDDTKAKPNDLIRNYRERQKEIPPCYKFTPWQLSQGPTCTQSSGYVKVLSYDPLNNTTIVSLGDYKYKGKWLFSDFKYT